jgi:hypothetical protein
MEISLNKNSYGYFRFHAYAVEPFSLGKNTRHPRNCFRMY